MTRLVFLDVETTGLNPEIHDVWEIGMIVRDHQGDGDVEHSWMVRPDLRNAEPKALEIGRYFERTAHFNDPVRHPDNPGWSDPYTVAETLAPLLAGAIVIGSNPSFDQAFLTRWLRERGQVWAAHYRTIDVVTLGAGRRIADETRMDPNLSSHDISRAFDVEPGDYDRHTALGDCRWVRGLYEAILRTGEVPF